MGRGDDPCPYHGPGFIASNSAQSVGLRAKSVGRSPLRFIASNSAQSVGLEGKDMAIPYIGFIASNSAQSVGREHGDMRYGHAFHRL